MSSRALLYRCGEALYGQRWQSEIARDLDVSDRTVRRWAAGAPVPEGIYTELRALIAGRAAELDRLVGLLAPRCGAR